ncbi:hypothetical protein L0337_22055 [candidate division KSB1 bacterium]|nr:hypothetical protein [candidate division KSB1 bacterium]
MGQQQLLLLILAAVVIGMAIVIGIDMFSENSLAANQDEVRDALASIAARAQGWYRRPAQLGGGGGTFIAITLDTINFDASSAGKFVLSSKTAGSFRITGISREDSAWSHSLMVYPDSIALAP